MDILKEDIENLLAQLIRIIKNRAQNTPEAAKTNELDDLQSAVNYLENCLYEINQYLGHLSRGELSIEPLSRKNYLAANLKQIHSDLKSLTWQANQVAQGDYKQRVNFLGDFSVSFNKMVSQLEEREKIMVERAEALLQSKLLLLSVVDSIKEWLIVIDVETREVLFENLAVKQQKSTNKCLANQTCSLYDEWLASDYKNTNPSDLPPIFEYECNCKNHAHRFLTIKPYSLDWNDRSAFAFLISDITVSKAQEAKLQDLAYKDELTGVFNRRYGMDEISRLMINKEEFLLCFIDIDKLKYVNDTHGHAAGDKYISSVAKFLQGALRSSDTLCRYGGDEFILVMPKCPEYIGAVKLAECRNRIINAARVFPMSISFGFAIVERDNVLGFEELLRQADKEMYDFKMKHRDELAIIHERFVSDQAE